MPSLSWYINRLGRMSAAEIGYRAARVARASVDRLASPAVPEMLAVPQSAGFMQRGVSLDASAYVSQAERLIEGRYSIFHLIDCELGHPPQWNRDPLTGTLAPLKPAASLDYRDEALVGNIKYLWEPNRHLHIPALAQAYVVTGDRTYANAVKTHIASWIEQCPPGRGANWSSSLELGIRLINWSIAWQLLGGYGAPIFADAEGRAFRDRWLESVYRHAKAIVRKLSRFSSANNHLIGETAGVYIAAITWNGWPQMQAWGMQCKEILSQEAIVQNAEDGGNKEQAFSYQQFVLDFLLLAGLAARAARDDFPPDYWRRIERMMEFLAAMMDFAGHVPMIGDADDGYVVRLAPHGRGLQARGDGLQPEMRLEAGGWPINVPDQIGISYVRVGQRLEQESAARAPEPSPATAYSLSRGIPSWSQPTASSGLAPTPSPQPPADSYDNYRSLLATGAALFKRADFARKARVLDDKTRWLLPPEDLADFVRLASSPGSATARVEFPQSGYYILGSDFDTRDEVRMVVDAGPLGYLSIAAHGHADALSVALSVGGEEVLVDPGTYAYHTEPEWRRYFRSTRAHNTILVDERDQSLQAGNFMWSRHAVARCLYFGQQGSVQRFLGEHDGYCTLREPLEHQREIRYDPTQRLFTIKDILEGQGTHEVCQHWHFAETLLPIAIGDEIHVATARRRIRLVPQTTPARAQFHRGGSAEEGGWISRSFGKKTPTTTVVWRFVAERRTILTAHIYVEEIADETKRVRTKSSQQTDGGTSDEQSG